MCNKICQCGSDDNVLHSEHFNAFLCMDCYNKMSHDEGFCEEFTDDEAERQAQEWEDSWVDAEFERDDYR